MKKYKIYQITSEGKWWLKEATAKADGTIGFINTFDENEAVVLSTAEVNEILYRVQTETKADIADIYTVEIDIPDTPGINGDTVIEAVKILKSLITTVGDSDISITDEDEKYAVRVLKTGVQLCRFTEDYEVVEEMFLAAERIAE